MVVLSVAYSYFLARRAPSSLVPSVAVSLSLLWREAYAVSVVWPCLMDILRFCP